MVSCQNLLKILDSLVEYLATFLETIIKLEGMDQNQELVHFQAFIQEDPLIVEEKEVLNLNGGLQILITNQTTIMVEVSDIRPTQYCSYCLLH